MILEGRVDNSEMNYTDEGREYKEKERGLGMLAAPYSWNTTSGVYNVDLEEKHQRGRRKPEQHPNMETKREKNVSNRNVLKSACQMLQKKEENKSQLKAICCGGLAEFQ